MLAIAVLAVSGALAGPPSPANEVLLAVETIRATGSDTVREVESERLYQVAGTGYGPAATQIALLIESGELQGDLYEAIAWLEQAEQLGDPDAPWQRARLLAKIGDPEAADVAFDAARQGVASASEFLYGLLMSSGRETEAVAHLETAADRGLGSAQKLVGLHYVAGRGVPQDLTRGYFWLLLAEAHGAVGAEQARKRVEAQLSIDEAKAAIQAAREWRPVVQEPGR